MLSTSQATTPIIRFIVIFAFILAFIFVILGIVLICIGATGDVKLSFYGQSMESTNIGFAAIFLGAVLFITIVLRALKSLETLGQTDKSIQNVAKVIWIGTPRLSSQNHFYTTSGNERNDAINVNNYRDENIACYVFSTQHQGSVPLYRLYDPATHDHFYATCSSERNKAISHYGYRDENISCYVYDSPTKGSIPLYRLYWHA